MKCACCGLPQPPWGTPGVDECDCPCDLCRGEQICPGCGEMQDYCRCDPDDDEWEID